MNKWKVSFWICFTLLTFTGGTSFYFIIDQAVTITYMQDGYSDTESDLENLTKIINKSDLQKYNVEELLKLHDLYEFMEFDNDSVKLQRSTLYFKEDKLEKVTVDW
jgi:hypothetical protein